MVMTMIFMGEEREKKVKGKKTKPRVLTLDTEVVREGWYR
jgi:hypothetical protein